MKTRESRPEEKRDPGNVRITHLECNVRRGNRIDGEQLSLAGLLEVP